MCPLAFGAAEKVADIKPTGYVIDLAHVITPDTQAKISAMATELQQKTGSQIAVVTVNSLEGETKEEYAVNLYKHLGIGSKKTNEGVLLLLAPKDRQYKIEVGYGLEPVINDARPATWVAVWCRDSRLGTSMPRCWRDDPDCADDSGRQRC